MMTTGAPPQPLYQYAQPTCRLIVLHMAAITCGEGLALPATAKHLLVAGSQGKVIHHLPPSIIIIIMTRISNICYKNH